MTVRECHIVQLFDSDESRAECVADFVTDGYRDGEPAIIVARPANWASTVAQLEVRGVAVQQAVADGMIVVKDAHDRLRRISRNGSPDVHRHAQDPLATWLLNSAHNAPGAVSITH